VREESPGISDRDVLSRAVEMNRILLTEDSDFGEWIFAHGELGGSYIPSLSTFRDRSHLSHGSEARRGSR
jgi:hypothetical protein